MPQYVPDPTSQALYKQEPAIIAEWLTNAGTTNPSQIPPSVTTTATGAPTPNRGSLTDRSGTITAGGTSQAVAPANPARKYLFVQNVSTADLWINFGAAATISQPSIKLPVNASFVIENAEFVCTDAVNIIGATTGQAYTAKEA